MEKLNRLGWADGLSFTAYGQRIGVRTDDPAVMPEVVERLPPGWRPSRSPYVDFLYSLSVGGEGSRRGVRRLNVLYADIERAARHRDLAQVLDIFEAGVMLYVALQTEARVFVHAGAVGWRGRAVLLPGRTRAGKSTLVAELVRAGATYYSDEYAVLDTRGRVHPYARALRLRDEGTGRQVKTAVEELGGRAGRGALPVGLVVLTEYREAGRWRPRRLTPGAGALAMFAHTVSAQRRPHVALKALGRVASDAVVVKSTRGDARRAAESILELLDG